MRTSSIRSRSSPVAPAADLVSSTATKTPTPLRDVPQAVTVVSRQLIADQGMQSMADVARYVPGVTMGQGEGNRDQPTIRGNTSTSTFFVNGVRDDVQYFRDLYNVERVEGLKGSNALIFGRGTGGGVINRVTKDAEWTPTRELTLQGGSYGTRRGAVDVGQGVSETVALRLNGMYENSDRFRHDVNVERYGINPAVAFAAGADTRITANYEHFYDYRTADRGIPSFRGQPAETDARTFFGDPSQSWSDARINVGTALIEHDVTAALRLRNRTVYGDYNKMYQNVFPGSVDSTGALVSISAYNNRNDRSNLFNQTEVTYRLATGSVTHTLLGGIEVGRQVSRNLRNTGFFDGTETSVTAPLDHPTISAAGHLPPERDRRRQPRPGHHARGLPPGPGGPDAVPAAHRGRPGRAVRSHLPQLPKRRGARPAGRPRLSPRRPGGEAGGAAFALRQLQRVVPAQLGRPVLVADGDHPDAGAREVRELRGGRQGRRDDRALAERRGVPARPDQHQRTRSGRSRRGRSRPAASGPKDSSSAPRAI